MYIYIYIYVLSSTYTVSLYHNSLVWLDPRDTSSWNRCWLVGWLFGFLWQINLCRLFNAKSIFIQIISSIF